MDKLGTALTTEARGQVSQILPLEVGRTAGHSVMGLKRSGFLEFQERLFEELTVAFVWLYGVGMMNNWLDKALGNRQKLGKAPIQYTQADWSFGFVRQFMPKRFWPKSQPDITLSPLERFTHSHSHLSQTLKTKGLKWGIAVGIPLALCGYVIPKFNQWKTRWIMDTFYRNKETNAPKATSLGEMRQILAPSKAFPSQSLTYPSALLQPPFPLRPAAPWAYTPQAPWNQGVSPWPLGPTRFGLSPSSLKGLSPISALGAAVDNTTYGQILVIDTGITGGRMMVASTRSPYESIECLARDMGALVFYLKTVPWIITGTGKALEKGFNIQNVIEMDAQAMSVVSRMLTAELQKTGQKDLASTVAQRLHQVQGPQLAKLKQIEAHLVPRLNQANTLSLQAAIRKHIAATTGSEKMAQTLFEHRVFQKSEIAGQDLAQVLEEVIQQRGPFARWSEAQRYSAGKSLRLAFETESGLTHQALIDAMRQVTAVDAGLARQMQQATQGGANRLAATILRESLNLHLNLAPHHTPEFSQAEALVRLVEHARLETGPLNTFAHDHLQWVLDEYKTFTQASGGKHPLKTQAAQKLDQLAQDLQKSLSAGQPLSTRQLTSFAQMLAQNGRKGPQWLWFMQGPSLKHLTQEVELVVPVISQAHHSADLTPLIEKQFTTWIGHAQQKNHMAVVQQLKTYQDKVTQLLQGEGRFQLLLNPASPDYKEALAREMGHLLKGDVAHNHVLLNKIMLALGRRPISAEAYFAEAEVNDLRHQVGRYAKLLSHKIDTLPGPVTLKKVSQAIHSLRKTHLTQRYSTYAVALAFSIWGIGIGLPKAIFWLTKRMTGQNQHPGLASLNAE